MKNSKKVTLCWAASTLWLSLFTISPVALADDADRYIQASRVLIGQADPGKFDTFFAETTPKLIDGPKAPLARYNPVSDEVPRGIVEFGHDLHRYKSEYTYATVTIPKPDRPSFEQYLTVLTALSLANEKAHFEQHKNRSLADFFVYRQDGDTSRACALYSLQQHVSDVTMLDMAVNLSSYFQSINSYYGMNAVLASLDRMNLKDIYLEFYSAADHQDRAAMTNVLKRLKAARDYINLNGMPACRKTTGEAVLPDAVIARAIEPAYPYLLTYGSASTTVRTPDYND